MISLLLGLAFAAADSLPPRQPGELDLHQIHTGRGNALLVVMPDGTTALVDAGEVAGGQAPEFGPRRPDGSRPAGEWIARYIRAQGYEKLDYALFTHYHDDHIGGAAALAAQLPIARWIDRGTSPPLPAYGAIQPYLAARGRSGAAVEVIRPGSADQVKPLRTPDVEIRTVAANGRIWTGRRDEVVEAFPPEWNKLPLAQQPGENHFSIALLLRYGAFRYFTGADLIGVALDGLPAWHDLETPVAKAVGEVDVAVINHHGWLDTTNDFFLKTLAPRVAILPAWHASHPDHGVLRRLRSPNGPRPELFTTTLLPATAAIVGYLKEPFKNKEGHIVVRVAPRGESYRVFVLDATSEAVPVLAVHGPYQVKGAGR